MLLYRVFLHDPQAAPGDSGHPTYIHRPQGAGRWDNPDLYDAWYLSLTPEGAIGETFGNIPTWSDEMIDHPTGLRRALAVFSIPDELPIFDFDDPENLLHLGMRPTQVVIRNKTFTQNKAAVLHQERYTDGSAQWAGLKWWSFHRPTWNNLMLWSTPAAPAPLKLQDIEQLTIATPTLIDAANTLSRSFR